jgi:hypothetical protein
MADENKIEAPELPPVVAQEAKLVGDEEVYAESHSVEPEVNVEQVDAQVPGKADPPADKVNVHEVFVATDEVITDTSDPRAVQVPDAGRGSLDLPIHALGLGHVEDRFAEEASEPEVPEEPLPGDTTDTD